MFELVGLGTRFSCKGLTCHRPNPPLHGRASFAAEFAMSEANSVFAMTWACVCLRQTEYIYLSQRPLHRAAVSQPMLELNCVLFPK